MQCAWAGGVVWDWHRASATLLLLVVETQLEKMGSVRPDQDGYLVELEKFMVAKMTSDLL
jgi:hypothetical protein